MAELAIAEGDEYAPRHGVSLREAFRVWLRVAMLSFGGPAGQIAVMHRILVEEKRWISESRFLHALNYCMLLPGPEAQQLATYIGWLMHRTLGGIMAGVLFVLPASSPSWRSATSMPATATCRRLRRCFSGSRPRFSRSCWRRSSASASARSRTT